jgi:hypothetical protein
VCAAGGPHRTAAVTADEIGATTTAAVTADEIGATAAAASAHPAPISTRLIGSTVRPAGK